MRALIIVVAVLATIVGEQAANAERPIYGCDDFKQGGDCICGSGEEPADDGNRKICVRSLRLIEPADGGIVDTTTQFSVDARGARQVQIEVCLVEKCNKHFTIFKQGVSRNRVTFQLSDLPNDVELYWRARAIRGGKFGRPTAVRRFRTVAHPPDATGIDLAAIDQLIAAGTFAAVVEAARRSTAAADHVEIAVRLAKVNQCKEVLEVVALPVTSGHGLESQLEQLQTDCDAALTNKAIVDAVDAGDPTTADEALAAYRTKHPQSVHLTFWSQAYVAAKRDPASCDDARSFVLLARTRSVAAPNAVVEGIDRVCPEPPPDLVAPSEIRFESVIAAVDYQIPITGRRTGEGLRYFMGLRLHLDRRQTASIASGVGVHRPFQAGIDGRLGAAWGAAGMFSIGMREPASLTVRGNFAMFGGRGKYFVEGDQHSVMVLDLLAGIAIRKRLGDHLFVTLSAGVASGFLVDFADQTADSYLDRFLDRWHGTVAFDGGIALEVR